MKGNLLAKITRFRAYQLGNPGSSFSYFDGTTFTLIEARLTDLNRPRIDKELEICGTSRVGVLHITSWDADHCAVNDLKEILKRYRPSRIEYPGYPPKTETAEECLVLIRGYRTLMQSAGVAASIQQIDPPYVNSLHPAEALGYRDIVYHPKYLSETSNNNSTVKLFRTGCFNVASLGDVEDNMISARLSNCPVFNSEVDAIILAHHGADNGFTTNRFLRAVRPTVAICSADYDNQFDHPREEIREMLNKYGIPLFTTKTGDVALQSLAPHTHAYRLINLKADSTERSSERVFKSKKSAKLRHNLDTVRGVYASTRKPFPR
jgi:competence protein ComEC